MLQVEKPGPSLRQPASSVKGQAVHILGSGPYGFGLVSTQFSHRSAKAAADNRYKNEHD